LHKENRKIKLAFVHDWFLQEGGAEQVAREIYALLAPFRPVVFCMLYNKNTLKELFQNKESMDVRASWLNKIPFAQTVYKSWLPLYPSAMNNLNLHPYELIISSSHSAAKNFRKKPGTTHICYCHTPSRYLWTLEKEYLQDYGLYRPLFSTLTNKILERLRKWDLQGSKQVDLFVANSNNVAERIKNYYKRDTVVIYPPVDVDFFTPDEKKSDIPEDNLYYFTSSRDVPYKKLDLIIWTFNQMPEKKLVVATQSNSVKRLLKISAKNVTIIPMGNRLSYRSWLRNSKAYIFAAFEDFGISPVEAMACGIPVIALGKGGVLETVKHGINGVYFKNQTVKSLTEAVEEFESIHFKSKVIRESVLHFSRKRFYEEFQKVLKPFLS